MRFQLMPIAGPVLLIVAPGAAALPPDDPRAPVPPSVYTSVLKGTKTFMPAGPMPWGEANKRVSPPAPKKTGKLTR
jgi:hypothetical protein